MNIEDVQDNQMLVLPTGEHGRVSRIDYDDNVVYVDVAVANGIDTIDMDPAELVPRDLVELRARVHAAAPQSTDPHHCAVCGQAIRPVPGGEGMTYVHSDSGAVAAPNPPSA